MRPTRGFNADICNKLSRKTVSFSDTEGYATILFNEMKIYEHLVRHKRSGELILVDLGDINVKVAALKNVQTLATHVLKELTFVTERITAFK